MHEHLDVFVSKMISFSCYLFFTGFFSGALPLSSLEKCEKAIRRVPKPIRTLFRDETCMSCSVYTVHTSLSGLVVFSVQCKSLIT